MYTLTTGGSVTADNTQKKILLTNSSTLAHNLPLIVLVLVLRDHVCASLLEPISRNRKF